MVRFTLIRADGSEVLVGDSITDFQGVPATFAGVSEEVGSDGTLIDVTESDGSAYAFYPRVFDLTLEIVDDAPKGNNRAARRAPRRPFP